MIIKFMIIFILATYLVILVFILGDNIHHYEGYYLV